MSYIGNPIVSTDFPVDYKNGDGSTTAFTLSIAPASVNAVDVEISGVTQSPQTYTISGVTLTFSAAPPSGTNNIVIRHRGVAGIPNVPAAASVGLTALSATGTPSANTFLRGDNTWGIQSGSVIQTVTATYSTATTTSNYTTFQDTGLTASITPRFSTSKIVVLVTNVCSAFNSAGGNSVAYFQTVRGATVIAYTRMQIGNALATGTNAAVVNSVTHVGVDSPATTSSVTYKMQMLANDTGYTITSCINNDIATMILMEVAA